MDFDSFEYSKKQAKKILSKSNKPRLYASVSLGILHRCARSCSCQCTNGRNVWSNNRTEKWDTRNQHTEGSTNRRPNKHFWITLNELKNFHENDFSNGNGLPRYLLGYAPEPLQSSQQLRRPARANSGNHNLFEVRINNFGI
ncbi:hypothetical protein OF001_U290043 [Pseudomonas sp. OF001]|nr:hypothetical protein OF001_U290043 [Pseudomonas sp. OF001]